MANSIDVIRGWESDWATVPHALHVAAPEHVVDILDIGNRRAQIIEWINTGWWKKMIQQACNTRWRKIRREIYESAVIQSNVQSNNSYKLPSDLSELFRIIMGNNPEYEDNIFHQIHNKLFPDEYIEFYMKSAEFSDWYNQKDTNGMTGKEYLLFGISDDFWEKWTQLVAVINETQKNLGRWLLRVKRSPLLLQIPKNLSEELEISIESIKKWDSHNLDDSVAIRSKKQLPRYWSSGGNWDNRTTSREWWIYGSPDKKIDITDEQRRIMEQLFIEKYHERGDGEKTIRGYLQWISWNRTIEDASEKRYTQFSQNIHTLLENVESSRKMYIKLFMRKLDNYGVPPDFFTREFIQLDTDSSDTITIKLDPIFFECIGKDELNNIWTDVNHSISEISTHITHAHRVKTYELEVTSL